MGFGLGEDWKCSLKQSAGRPGIPAEVIKMEEVPLPEGCIESVFISPQLRTPPNEREIWWIVRIQLDE